MAGKITAEGRVLRTIGDGGDGHIGVLRVVEVDIHTASTLDPFEWIGKMVRVEVLDEERPAGRLEE